MLTSIELLVLGLGARRVTRGQRAAEMIVDVELRREPASHIWIGSEIDAQRRWRLLPFGSFVVLCTRLLNIESNRRTLYLHLSVVTDNAGN
jgi:hypothetical protein